jgi:hypothetical protein
MMNFQKVQLVSTDDLDHLLSNKSQKAKQPTKRHKMQLLEPVEAPIKKSSTAPKATSKPLSGDSIKKAKLKEQALQSKPSAEAITLKAKEPPVVKTENQETPFKAESSSSLPSSVEEKETPVTDVLSTKVEVVVEPLVKRPRILEPPTLLDEPKESEALPAERVEGSPVLSTTSSKKKKRVSWAPDEALLSIKEFLKEDEASTNKFFFFFFSSCSLFREVRVAGE